MSRTLYEALLRGGADLEADLGAFEAFCDAAAARRGAIGLAQEEFEAGSWAGEEERADEGGATPLARLAADEGGPARYASEGPVPVAGAEGWALEVTLDPALGGGSLVTVERVWTGDGTPPAAPRVVLAIGWASSERSVRVLLPAERAMAQVVLEESAGSGPAALAWVGDREDQ